MGGDKQKKAVQIFFGQPHLNVRNIKSNCV